MLDLKDFFYLSALDAVMDELAAPEPGLVVVTGLDPRPHAAAHDEDEMLPSGRATIFRILVRRLLAEGAAAGRMPSLAVVAAHRDAVRLPRGLRHTVAHFQTNAAIPYAEAIAEAARRQPDLLVIDALDRESAPAALAAARDGRRVLTQMDTVFRGADVGRYLTRLGATPAMVAALRWVVAVHRLPGLCPHCKQPVATGAAELAELQRRYPHLAGTAAPSFFRGAGCDHCRGTGALGGVTAFDVYRAAEGDPPQGSSRLALEQYVLELAASGQVAIDQALNLEAAQMRHVYRLLVTSEQALKEANVSLQRRLAQLEAANKVMEERTEALVSLQQVSETLLSAADFREQAHRVCLQCCALLGAERAVLYYLMAPGTAQILASPGWDPARVPARVDARHLGPIAARGRPEPLSGPPPGIPFGDPDKEGAELRSGLQVALLAGGRRVGLLVVHSTRKASFSAGEASLLQTFANQVALAIQRAGLFEELRQKVAALEAAQAGLAQKERLEREMELARQVQQRMLPRTFPRIPGFQFASLNEPARHVGGDFYDVIPLDDDHFGVAVADVSDKGMPAALYMALTRSLLLAEARRSHSPAAVLRAVNDLLLHLGEPDMFVTLFYGVIDRPGGRLTYARAGHDYPFLLRGGRLQELDGPGIVLGLLDTRWLGLAEVEVGLEPGDRLVLYSDGLTDVNSPDGQLYDREQLKSLLQAHAARPPEEICRVVFDALKDYQGTAEQFDDMTLLVVGVE